MAIDDLLTDMHDDDLKLIRALRGKLDDHVLQQHEASIALITTLGRHIKELREQEFLLLPEGGMLDANRRERQGLERERREKELSLAHVKIQLLRDLQPSLMYELHLTREQLEREQERARFENTFYDS